MKFISFILLVFPFVLVAQSYNFVISNGSDVRLNGGYLTLNNTAFQNAGDFQAAVSTVVMRGNVSKVYSGIGGGGYTRFGDLEIDKSANDVYLTGDILVYKNLIMSSGNLDLYGFELEIGIGANGSIVGESETTRIYGPIGGEVVKKVVLNAPTNENPGNIGLGFTSTGNLGYTIIRRRHTQFPLGGGTNIERHFNIDAATSLSNVDLQFYYFDAEIGAFNESQLVFWQDPNDIADWTRTGKNTSSSSSDYVKLNNTTAFGNVTLGLNNLYLAPKVFLQGPYNTGSNKMDAKLAQNTLVPNTEPYAAMGIAGIQNAFQTLSIPSANPSSPQNGDIIDWVLIEIRDASNPATVLSRRAALLRRDGQISASAFGLEAVSFIGIGAGDYHVAIRHRNHLGVMTQMPLSFN